jgi:uncharacterized protein YdhG (YjbR/CyaY superfamily)
MSDAARKGPETIDAYIADFPPDVQERLQTMRQTVHAAAPGLTEAIAYGMPTFRLKGKNVIHFGAFTNHIGLYPTPSGIEAFAERLAPYAGGKGSARFPNDQPLPLDLVTDIVRFRVAEVGEKTGPKR